MAFGGLGRISGFGSLRPLGPQPMPIAIDFGVGALKVLQLSSGEEPSLVAAAMQETPDELLGQTAKRIAFQAGALPRLMREAGFKGKRAVCAIPAGLTFCKHMQFQKGDGVPVAALVEAALPVQIGCDPSALVFRHIEVGDFAKAGGGARTEVICMAAAREMVSRLMGAIKASKLEPVGMQSEFVATLKAFEGLSGGTGDGIASMYLDLGSGSTKVLIAQGPKLVFAKTVEVGGRHLDEAAAKQLGCGLGAARSRRLESGAGRGGDEPVSFGAGGGAAVCDGVDLGEPLEILTDEVAMCVRYYAGLFPQRPVERVLFVGGEARSAALCQSVAKRLRVAAQAADPMAAVKRTGSEPAAGVDFEKAQPGWAMLVGLSLCPTDL